MRVRAVSVEIIPEVSPGSGWACRRHPNGRGKPFKDITPPKVGLSWCPTPGTDSEQIRRMGHGFGGRGTLATSTMNPHARTLSPEYLAAQMGWVRSLARSLVRDPSEADDVSQEVWLAAAERPPRSAANPRGWLATVTRHIAQARGRAEARRRRRERLASGLEGGQPEEDVLARGEACQRVVALVMA